MVDPKTGEKKKAELRDIKLSHVAFADRPANREEGYAVVKNLNTTLIQKADSPTKRENDQDFPAEAYAYVPDPDKPSTWKLRLWETLELKETAVQVGRAVAALGEGFRGNKVEIPADDLPAVKRKVKAAWKRTHEDADEMPDVLKDTDTDVEKDKDMKDNMGGDSHDGNMGEMGSAKVPSSQEMEEKHKNGQDHKVEKAEKAEAAPQNVVVVDPPASNAVPVPLTEQLLDEKIAVLKKQIDDALVLLKSGGYGYEVWNKWWNAHDLLSALAPEAAVVSMAKTDAGRPSFEVAVDHVLAIAKALTEKAKVTAVAKNQQLEALQAEKTQAAAKVIELQKTLDTEKARAVALQKSLDEIGGTARSSALPTERETGVTKTTDIWAGLKLF